MSLVTLATSHWPPVSILHDQWPVSNVYQDTKKARDTSDRRGHSVSPTQSLLCILTSHGMPHLFDFYVHPKYTLALRACQAWWR